MKPTDTVVELGAGGGWYTELLAPLLARRGKLVVAAADPNGPADQMSTVYGKRIATAISSTPALYDKVQLAPLAPPTKMDLGTAGKADVVVAFREIHNWQRSGNLDAYLAAVHAALKDGGTFGVVAHRAPEGADAAVSVEKGYLPQAWVVEKVTAAGFKLDGSSEVNANPKDTKDYPDGVWQLPPNLRADDKDKARLQAIGESDRMTLKFVKVAKK